MVGAEGRASGRAAAEDLHHVDPREPWVRSDEREPRLGERGPRRIVNGALGGGEVHVEGDDLELGERGPHADFSGNVASRGWPFGPGAGPEAERVPTGAPPRSMRRMASLHYVATRLELDPALHLISFANDDDDVGLSLLGGEAQTTLADVELWYGEDDSNRASDAIARASLAGAELLLTLTERGAQVTGGAREVRVELAVPDLEIELRALGELLKLLFESAPDRLTLGAPSAPKARESRAEPERAVEPAARLFLRLLAEKRLIELVDDAALDAVAARLAPVLSAGPEKLAAKAAVAFLFDDPDVAEVYADEDVLRGLAREFAG